MKTLLILVVSPLYAHVMSMSTGDITVEGARAHYELRMPKFELPHIQTPESSLFEHIRFSTAGQPARLTRKS